MFRPGGPPVVEAGLKRDAVGETMGDGEAPAALELSEDNDHLPVEGRNTIHCL